jgi:hypothetical protein
VGSVPVLVVVDYAETRTGLPEMLTAAARADGGPWQAGNENTWHRHTCYLHKRPRRQ